MHTITPQQMRICTDYDLIALRQAIRQSSRVVGLGPAQQARITAAISEVAQALLSGLGDGLFIIQLAAPTCARPALEVACAAARPGCGDHTSQIYGSAAVSLARALVDETQVQLADPGPQLLMRMWIG